MSRAEVIADVIRLAEDALAGVEPGMHVGVIVNSERAAYVTALAILGALGEYDRGERDAHVSEVFGRLRSAAQPTGVPAGADATDREEVEARTEGLRTPAPADQPDDDVADTVVRLAFMMNRQQDRIRADHLLVLQLQQLRREIGELLTPEPTSTSTGFVPSDEVAKPETPAAGGLEGWLQEKETAAVAAPEPFACVCGRTFVNTQGLGRHRAFCASLIDTRRPVPAPRSAPAEPIGEHPCQYCDRTFPSARALIGHQSYCAGAKAARLAKQTGAVHLPDPPPAQLGPPEPLETTADVLPPGLILRCGDCDSTARNAAVLDVHTRHVHRRGATRDERTPQRAEVAS